MRNKKALSPVIATVLLILITIAAAGIITGVLIPFVKDRMSKAQECSQIINEAEALTVDAEDGYACYSKDEETNKKTVNITIHRGNIDIKGIKISIRGAGDSKIFDIYDNTDGAKIGVSMFDGTATLDLPEKTGEKTYSISNLDAAESAVIAPIMESGQICKETDKIDLEAC